jgi:cell division septal protein FtsQ
MSSQLQRDLQKALSEESARVGSARRKIKTLRLAGLVAGVAGIAYGIFAGFSIFAWGAVLVGVVLLVVAQTTEAKFVKQLRP